MIETAGLFEPLCHSRLEAHPILAVGGYGEARSHCIDGALYPE